MFKWFWTIFSLGVPEHFLTIIFGHLKEETNLCMWSTKPIMHQNHKLQYVENYVEYGLGG